MLSHQHFFCNSSIQIIFQLRFSYFCIDLVFTRFLTVFFTKDKRKKILKTTCIYKILKYINNYKYTKILNITVLRVQQIINITKTYPDLKAQLKKIKVTKKKKNNRSNWIKSAKNFKSKFIKTILKSQQLVIKILEHLKMFFLILF